MNTYVVGCEHIRTTVHNGGSCGVVTPLKGSRHTQPPTSTTENREEYQPIEGIRQWHSWGKDGLPSLGALLPANNISGRVRQ